MQFKIRSLALSLTVLCAFAHQGALHAQSLSPKTEAKLNSVINSPKLKEAHVGISILDLGSVRDANAFPAKPYIGKPYRVLFEHDAQKKFMPASNMKLFTAAIALQKLGIEKTFPTRVFQYDKQLVLYGGGDPSLKISDLKNLGQQIKAHGVSEISSVVGDGSAYTAETSAGKFPFGWILDDTRWYYGPEVSALAIERNHVDVSITGASQTGAPAKTTLNSVLAGTIGITANVKTGTSELSSKSEDQQVGFEWMYVNPYRGQDVASDSNNIADRFGKSDYLIVNGQIAPEQKLDLGIQFPNPPQIAAKTLANELGKAGIRFAPQKSQGLSYNASSASRFTTIAEHESLPLGFLLQRLLKNSDNLYAEMLLRNVAYYGEGIGGDKAGPRAHEILKRWLILQGIDATPLRLEDGSGLSRYNLLTPRATVELLAAINRMPEGRAIWDALPIAGVDGTLRKRMNDFPAKGNVRAKTGTLSIASNLSGYVTTRDNRRLAVALYINFARDSDTAQWAQDEVFKILAAQT